MPQKRFGALHENCEKRFKLRSDSKASRVLPGIDPTPSKREPNKELKPGRPRLVLGIGAWDKPHALPKNIELQLYTLLVLGTMQRR